MSGGRDQNPVEVDKMPDVLAELEDRTAISLLQEVVMLLRKIEYHQSIGTDADLKDYEV